MKNSIVFLFCFLSLNFIVQGQGTVPMAFKYQGVARDVSHKPYIDTDLMLRMTLKYNNPPGTTGYQEIHKVRTSALGVFSMDIGRGTDVSGSLDSLPWASGNINLAVEMSLDNGVNWTHMGESPLLSVPYAQMAKVAHSLVDEPAFIADSQGQTRVSTVEEPGGISFMLKGQTYAKLHFLSPWLPTFEIYDPTGNGNLGIGVAALSEIFGGISNTALGTQSLWKNTSGDFNTAVGASALANNLTGKDNTAIGAFSLVYNQTGSYNTALGSSILQNNTTGSRNTAVGFQSMKMNLTGEENTAVGNQCLMQNFAGKFNAALGVYALQNNTGGNGNSALGSNTLHFNSSGGGNTAVGGNALYQNQTGFYNTAVGVDALRLNNSGSHNVAVGNAALLNTVNVGAQVAIGDSALFHTSTGYTNTAVGYNSLHSNNIGYGNTALGFTAGLENISGSFNTFLGRETGSTGTSLNNTTAVGAQAKTTRSNQIVLGNTSVTSIGGFASWTNFSDKRYKTHVKENVPGLSFVMALIPVTYQLDIRGIGQALGESDGLKSSDAISKEQVLLEQGREQKARIRYSGFLAQDVEAAARSLEYDFSGVDKPENQDGFYGLRYSDFVPSLVKAIQEQQKMIQILQKENQDIRKRLEILESKLAK